VPVPAPILTAPVIVALDGDVQGDDHIVVAMETVNGVDVHFLRSKEMQHVSTPMRHPQVRWIGPARALLYDIRTQESQPNAVIIDKGGGAALHLSIGDAVENVLWIDDYIVATYFDEGVFGEQRCSRGGIVIFNRNAQYVWGWNSSPAGASTPVYDCYAAAHAGDKTIGALIYTSFRQGSYAFAMLDVETRSIALHAVPPILYRTHALTYGGDGAWLFAVRADGEQHVIAWQPGHLEFDVAPAPVRLTRGVKGSRFFSITDQAMAIVTVGLAPEDGRAG
jgi:hypothetical protein